ncbi:hypothetical protein SS1G_07293 [Sclerotinia sclerotiorum 1980 UF-70]|uniref:Uncharacterized protein n=1 Tax=Sclerotinia sclerotiorum (strain ATCC 18683 / 1980 / Ss-1) TaxID=665079 RepID=A7EPP4_SCLS1|nr:hypothetical protein SS1G_07293 [Sclerotinia sclerotiorum 1980 UF-70]EDO04810.1 hypothetical protein SS1G_07293 [Sclerotinia sclerotiorum 1980 UF-70]
MAPRGPRKQHQRGEEVHVVGDANNHAFKAQAVNSRKRPIKPQPSADKDTIAIDSDDEPRKKARPDPRSSAAKLRAPKQDERPTESSEEEVGSSPEVIARPNLPPTKLLQPFADKDADDALKYIEACLILGLTMYKNPPQAIASRAICTFDANRHPLPTNSTCHTRDSSLFLPQYDGSFDDVGMGNMAGGPEAAVHLDTRSSISFLGTLQPSFQPSLQNQANAHQEKGDSIKLGEGTATQLGGVDPTPQTQKVMGEQVVTPPSSPTKVGAGTETVHMISENPQVHLSSKISPEGDTIAPLENPMKAVIEPERGMFSENLSIARSSTERQFEIEIGNANDKIDEQCQPKLQPNQLPSSHQVLPEEQLQTTVFSGNTIGAEIKVEQNQQVTDPMSKVLPSIRTSPENQIEVSLDETLMVEEPQQGNNQTIQVPGAHVSPARQTEAPADPSLTIEGPKQAPRIFPQMSLGAQELSEREAEARVNGKSMAEGEQQPKLDQIMNESSSKNHSALKTVLPTTEKPNNNTQNQGPLVQQATTLHSDVLEAYHSLFLCYYNCPPTISTTDVSNATRQSNLLIKLATLYGSLKIVRPHIIASLLSQGRNLYSAIRQDPPRFLILADKLQCTTIFKEALVHIVGQLPSWPWPTPQDRIDVALSRCINKKTQELRDKKHKVAGALFRSCLVKDGVRVSINNLDKKTFDLWVMVQIWHDWFSQQLHRCAHARIHEYASVEKNMYKLLAQGGDAYLKIDDVMSMVEQFKAVSESREWGHWEKDEVELQLNIMKEYAAKKVKGFMVNELMGDNSGVNGELAYLTCTKVDDYELPWTESQIIED